MSSCLGLYIENNIIKYAKVSKDNNITKVEAFGVKFYDRLDETIKQIVEETYSFKIPLSINISEEIYNKFEIFSLLSKKDIDHVVETEFENVCYDKDTSPNIFEQRYIIANSNVQNDKLRVIHLSVPKTVIAQKKNQLEEYKLKSILPIGVTIPNLLNSEKQPTSLIVNIERFTTITKVFNNALSDVQVFPIGAQNIIDNISKKENSYSKAYEICKNTTIYTEKDQDLQYEENEFLPDIMPTLFQIASEVRKIIDESFEKIEKVYITGTAAIINNIDIYFQDFLRDVQCEILRPSFINNNSKINIKDYIETNSAISIALHGIDKPNEVNLLKEPTLQILSNALNSDAFGFLKTLKNNNINIGILDKFKSQYNVTVITLLLITALYFVGTGMMNYALEQKTDLAKQSIEETNQRIEKLNEYNLKFNQTTTNYEALIRKIESINDANSEDKRYKNTIPNLLNNIMAVIPKNVQLSSIENTSNTHIVITARSVKYEQIAFFKTKLKTEEILRNVVSDTGTMKEGYLTVTIEGELP